MVICYIGHREAFVRKRAEKAARHEAWLQNQKTRLPFVAASHRRVPVVYETEQESSESEHREHFNDRSARIAAFAELRTYDEPAVDRDGNLHDGAEPDAECDADLDGDAEPEAECDDDLPYEAGPPDNRTAAEIEAAWDALCTLEPEDETADGDMLIEVESDTECDDLRGGDAEHDAECDDLDGVDAEHEAECDELNGVNAEPYADCDELQGEGAELSAECDDELEGEDAELCVECDAELTDEHAELCEHDPLDDAPLTPTAMPDPDVAAVHIKGFGVHVPHSLVESIYDDMRANDPPMPIASSDPAVRARNNKRRGTKPRGGKRVQIAKIKSALERGGHIVDFDWDGQTAAANAIEDDWNSIPAASTSSSSSWRGGDERIAAWRW
jgi:hypothetical protein